MATAAGPCPAGNDFNGNLGARVSSIFVILVGSMIGACFPIYARRKTRGNRFMEAAFFFAKYFGSGVIVATALIHLLAPATQALTNPCLTGIISQYSWPEGICLMTIFVLFFLELMTARYAKFGHSHDDEHDSELAENPNSKPEVTSSVANDHADMIKESAANEPHASHARGEDHLGHGREHTSNEEVADGWEEAGAQGHLPESYVAQMTAIFILEFGVIFHSIFIGLTLAVAGDEFPSLYVVLVFHQTFEGLGLGTRLASAPWPKSKRWTPYVLAMAYGVSTPLAIGIGLGVRKTYPPGSQTTLIVNGVFDSISAGILIYTGLVELMAHEFMFSPTMRKAPIRTVLVAYVNMCLGAGLMALLGKWA